MRVAYLASQYPAPSHTFIAREVDALRRYGVDLHTFTVRGCPESQLRREADQQAAKDTWSILGRDKSALAFDQLRTTSSQPGRYLKGLSRALSMRPPGFRNGLWSSFYFAEAVSLAQELKRRKIDHLHCHFANAASQVAYLCAKLLGIEWSMTLHGTACFNSELGVLLGEKIADCRFVACVSDFGRAQAKRVSSPQDWEKIILVRCGLDLRLIPERPPRRARRPRLITVGRLVPTKGQLDLVDAFAAVVRAGVDAELCILGEGELREPLEARVREHGLEDRCSLPGAVAVEDVLDEVSKADVFALSSFMEGLPVVLMEAMAVGTAVVAPRVAGIPELVEDGTSGLLYTPARPDQLADCLTRLLGDAELRQRCVEAGRKRVEEEFDVDKAVRPLLPYFLPHTTPKPLDSDPLAPELAS